MAYRELALLLLGVQMCTIASYRTSVDSLVVNSVDESSGAEAKALKEQFKHLAERNKALAARKQTQLELLNEMVTLLDKLSPPKPETDEEFIARVEKRLGQKAAKEEVKLGSQKTITTEEFLASFKNILDGVEEKYPSTFHDDDHPSVPVEDPLVVMDRIHADLDKMKKMLQDSQTGGSQTSSLLEAVAPEKDSLEALLGDMRALLDKIDHKQPEASLQDLKQTFGDEDPLAVMDRIQADLDKTKKMFEDSRKPKRPTRTEEPKPKTQSDSDGGTQSFSPNLPGYVPYYATGAGKIVA